MFPNTLCITKCLYNTKCFGVISAMTDKINLKKIEQTANRLLSQDGLTEMLLGAIFFVSSASMTGKGSFIPFLPLYVLFLSKIVEGFRKRYTYPRIGYVKAQAEESREVSRGILTFIGGTMIIFVIGVYLTTGTFSSAGLYKWLPVGIGVFMYGPFRYLYEKTGERINLAYIAFMVIGGILFSQLTFSDIREGPQFYLLVSAGFFILAGVARFYLFTRNNPVLEVPQDE